MVKTQYERGRSRRAIIQLASGAGLGLLAQQYSFAASDFWDKKKPAEWSDEERNELRTKSPWAKKLNASSSGGGRAGGGGGGEGDGGGFGGGGGGGRRGGGGGGGRGGGLAPAGNFGSAVPLSVIWENAKPIQDAHPLNLPPQLQNHYVIAVTGIPQQALVMAVRAGLGGRGRGPEGGAPEAAPAAPADQTAPLKAGVTLSVKGKDPLHPDTVLATNRNATLLFGFTKDTLPLSVTDKDVEFALKLGNLSGKTKFNLKDMMYNNELAV